MDVDAHYGEEGEDWAVSGLYCEGSFNYYDEETWGDDYGCYAYHLSYDSETGNIYDVYCYDTDGYGSWCYY